MKESMSSSQRVPILLLVGDFTNSTHFEVVENPMIRPDMFSVVIVCVMHNPAHGETILWHSTGRSKAATQRIVQGETNDLETTS